MELRNETFVYSTKEYYILVYGCCEHSYPPDDDFVKISGTTSSSYKMRVVNSLQNYPTIENPFSATIYDGRYSIYCSYTESGAPGGPYYEQVNSGWHVFRNSANITLSTSGWNLFRSIANATIASQGWHQFKNQANSTLTNQGWHVFRNLTAANRSFTLAGSGWHLFKNLANITLVNSGWHQFKNQANSTLINQGWHVFRNLTAANRSWELANSGWHQFKNQANSTLVNQGWHLFRNYSTANDLPELTDFTPANNSTAVEVIATICLTLYDLDGQLINATILSNASGSWAVIGNLYNKTNGEYCLQIPEFNEYNRTYYWRVNLSDGEDYNLSAIFKFTTGDYSPSARIIVMPHSDYSIALLAIGIIAVVAIGLWFIRDQQRRKNNQRPGPPYYPGNQ
jgi:hypothetical protein